MWLTYVEDEAQFDDPSIDPVINVSCHTNFTAGKMDILLEYTGNEPYRFAILRKDISFHTYRNHHNGTLLAEVRFPHKGRLTCHVIDKRGNYSIYKDIDITGKSLQVLYVHYSTFLMFVVMSRILTLLSHFV